MHILFGFLLVIIVGIALFFLLGVIRTWQMQHGKQQKQFLSGKMPDPLPHGFYKGFAKGYTGPWIGKTFHKDTATGTNDFSINKKNVKQFVFRTYVGQGLQDKSISVLKLDYNILTNPFFVRMILDEIRETEQNFFLGKIHIRILPYITFTVGYFTLRKEQK